MSRLLWLALSLVAVEHSAASAQPLVFDELKPMYSDISVVRFSLRNAGSVRLWLNSFCPDRVFLEKLAADGTSWTRASEMWCCLNAGAGTPQSLPPGGSVRLRVPIPPFPGRYRIRGEYSLELWGNVAQIPKRTETYVSPVFEAWSQRGR
jgi:hypothetical protein